MLRVDCIRVTHPYATLGVVLLQLLPFGLHVLGLPLAFILSQDQTLHSINPLSNFNLINPKAISASIKPSYILGLFLLSLISNTSRCSLPPLKNQLEVNLYRSTPGPLSISIYSMNVCVNPPKTPCCQEIPRWFQY